MSLVGVGVGVGVGVVCVYGAVPPAVSICSADAKHLISNSLSSGSGNFDGLRICWPNFRTKMNFPAPYLTIKGGSVLVHSSKNPATCLSVYLSTFSG